MAEESSFSLYVGNLNYRTESEGLLAAFNDTLGLAMPALSAQVIKDNSPDGNGESKGFGFVKFNSDAERQAALAACGGGAGTSGTIFLDNRDCKVNLAHGPRSSGGGSGSGSGNYRGGRGRGRGGFQGGRGNYRGGNYQQSYGDYSSGQGYSSSGGRSNYYNSGSTGYYGGNAQQGNYGGQSYGQQSYGNSGAY